MTGPIKSTFCDIETVSCVLGLSVDRIYELVESGRYLWVWNVTAGASGRRELRFWAREINDPAAVSNFTLDTVIEAAVPRRNHIRGQYNGLRNWEFRQLLRLSKPALHNLRRELCIRGRRRHLFVPRAKLERFFRRRWLGNLDSDIGKMPRRKTKDHKLKN